MSHPKWLRYPKFLPSPISWLNALALSGLLILYATGASYVLRGIVAAINPSSAIAALQFSHHPQFFGIQFSLYLLVFFLVSPVLFIAISHHWLHVLLTKFIPKIQSAVVGPTKGWWPGLMSWWEGIWGLCVAMVSLALGFSLSSVIFWEVWGGNLELQRRAASFSGFVWFISAAYLYHVFHLVEHRIFDQRKGTKIG
jgi:hypothetical protein